MYLEAANMALLMLTALMVFASLSFITFKTFQFGRSLSKTTEQMVDPRHHTSAMEYRTGGYFLMAILSPALFLASLKLPLLILQAAFSPEG